MVDSRTPSTPRELHAERCTAYHLRTFGYHRIELREIRIHVAPFAQYKAALHVNWIAKGRRKTEWHVEYDRGGIGLVVLDGHGHRQPPNWLTEPKIETRGDGVIVKTSASRWASCDPAWAHEFDRTMRDYLAEATSTGALLADYREFDLNRDERINELRARGGVGPFEAGDRVVTPKGNGAVKYRRMDPATDHREVAVYSVKLDGHDHAGIILPAADVRWEGAAP